MGIRYRKRVKVAPGLTFNLSWSSKKGLTTSSTVGVPGANINIGTKKDGALGVKRGTLGIPGSGLSYHENLDNSSVKKNSSTKKHDSNIVENIDYSEDGCEEGDSQENNQINEELTLSDYVTAPLEFFAYSRTVNWLINIVVLGVLVYINK